MKRPKLTLGIAHTSNMFILLAEEGMLYRIAKVVNDENPQTPIFIIIIVFIYLRIFSISFLNTSTLHAHCWLKIGSVRPTDAHLWFCCDILSLPLGNSVCTGV